MCIERQRKRAGHIGRKETGFSDNVKNSRMKKKSSQKEDDVEWERGEEG